MSARTKEISRIWRTQQGKRIKIWTNAAGPDAEGVISSYQFPYCVLVDTIDLHTGEFKGEHYIRAKFITKMEFVPAKIVPPPATPEDPFFPCAGCGLPLGDLGYCDNCDSEIDEPFN